MQPTYLAWPGYFNLIASVDRFVFLDDVQFERRSWQSRNRILAQGKEQYLTVPVRKAAREEIVANMQLDSQQDWRQHHLLSLQHAYSRAPFGGDVISLVQTVLARGQERLVDLNVDLIAAFADILGLAASFTRATQLGCEGRRSEHLANICRAVDCAEYLSPVGSRDYLVEDQFESRYGISLAFQQFTPQPYPQIGGVEFVSHLSIVDVLAHCGPEDARAYVLRGSVT
jgi:hypothetical protein